MCFVTQISLFWLSLFVSPEPISIREEEEEIEERKIFKNRNIIAKKFVPLKSKDTELNRLRKRAETLTDEKVY